MQRLSRATAAKIAGLAGIKIFIILLTLATKMKKNNCKDCDGLGYYTDVISSGLIDPNDPYHEPHTERCDTCKVFEDDEQAHEHVKKYVQVT